MHRFQGYEQYTFNLTLQQCNLDDNGVYAKLPLESGNVTSKMYSYTSEEPTNLRLAMLRSGVWPLTTTYYGFTADLYRYRLPVNMLGACQNTVRLIGQRSRKTHASLSNYFITGLNTVNIGDPTIQDLLALSKSCERCNFMPI